MKRIFIICFLLISLAFGYRITEIERIVMPDSICEVEFIDVGESTIFISRYEDYMSIWDFESYHNIFDIVDSSQVKFAENDSSLYMIYDMSKNEELGTSQLKTRKIYPSLEEEQAVEVDYLVEEWLPFWNYNLDALDMILTVNRDSSWSYYDGISDIDLIEHRREYHFVRSGEILSGNLSILPQRKVAKANDGFVVEGIDYKERYTESTSREPHTIYWTMELFKHSYYIKIDFGTYTIDTIFYYGSHYFEGYRDSHHSEGYRIDSYRPGIFTFTNQDSIHYLPYTVYEGSLNGRGEGDDFWLTCCFPETLLYSCNINILDRSIPRDSIPPFLMLGRFFTNTGDHGRMGLIFGDQYCFYPDFDACYTFEDYDERYDKFENYHDIDHDGIDEVYALYGDTIVFYHMFEGDGVDDEPEKPSELQISISPNPFNSAMRISANENIESIEIYDVVGNLIDDIGKVDSREYLWQPASDIGSGIYMVKIRIGGEFRVSRVVYLK
ncbi:MAG: T9SS type A sorting domain-containing protein [Candidatus Zixiibacteriota bacterium]